jgi:hypothetical protein
VTPFIIVVVLVVIGLLIYNMFRSRNQRMKAAERESKTAAATGLAVSRDLFEAEVGHHPPLESFHVVGDEARVTFDVPLGEENDEVLNELLTNEAIEVLRHKKHTLPIDGVEHIVVFAGRDKRREVARHTLPSAGELPPPVHDVGVSLAYVAHDPFAAHFDEQDQFDVAYGTTVDVPGDELAPLVDELRIPQGLDRGLRALGTDPSDLSGPDLVIALLRMFGYGVTEQAYEGSYMATKDGTSTYIETDRYEAGDHPELDEKVIRRFLANFGTSGADRGMLISDKYGPFKIHEIETNQPRVRFVTRERVQRFIDSMALG